MSDAKNWLAFLVVLSFVAVVMFMIHFPPTGSEGAMAVLNMLIGILGGGFTAVISYFFGSSSGGEKQAATIAALAKPSEKPVEPANGGQHA
jgi:hypothetical protein